MGDRVVTGRNALLECLNDFFSEVGASEDVRRFFFDSLKGYHDQNVAAEFMALFSSMIDVLRYYKKMNAELLARAAAGGLPPEADEYLASGEDA